jgi:SAM-dependent methyltransferase
MSYLPLSLPEALEPSFVEALDPPGKLVAAIAALGSVADADVLVVDADRGPIVLGLGAAGARVTHAGLTSPLKLDVADASADVVLGLWSAFRGLDRRDLSEVDRVLRPGGRHLVVHDYGRDDVSRLNGERPEYGAWSQRTGPFLAGGFRVRVVHCFWEFPSAELTTQFLAGAFGETGTSVAATLKRPRLSYNVAIYHRTRP